VFWLFSYLREISYFECWEKLFVQNCFCVCVGGVFIATFQEWIRQELFKYRSAEPLVWYGYLLLSYVWIPIVKLHLLILVLEISRGFKKVISVATQDLNGSSFISPENLWCPQKYLEASWFFLLILIHFKLSPWFNIELLFQYEMIHQAYLVSFWSMFCLLTSIVKIHSWWFHCLGLTSECYLCLINGPISINIAGIHLIQCFKSSFNQWYLFVYECRWYNLLQISFIYIGLLFSMFVQNEGKFTLQLDDHFFVNFNSYLTSFWK
jgi:hypothetical protein